MTTKNTPKAISVRIDGNLYRKAEIAAKADFRSARKQLEQWATLGCIVASHIRKEEISAINLGLMRLKCEVESGEPIDVDDVLAEFSDETMQQTASDYVKNKGQYIFEASKTVPGLLDQVFKDGTRITGKFIEGKFTPLK